MLGRVMHILLPEKKSQRDPKRMNPIVDLLCWQSTGPCRRLPDGRTGLLVLGVHPASAGAKRKGSYSHRGT